MKKIIALVSLLCLIGLQSEAQKIFGTRNGKITFESPTDGDVKAGNNEWTNHLQYVDEGFQVQICRNARAL
jgi:hypothetical protein